MAAMRSALRLAAAVRAAEAARDRPARTLAEAADRVARVREGIARIDSFRTEVPLDPAAAVAAGRHRDWCDRQRAMLQASLARAEADRRTAAAAVRRAEARRLVLQGLLDAVRRPDGRYR